jgi:hypothetical protein
MKTLLFVLLFLQALSLHAQTDVLVLEKKGANLRTYATGTEISLQTIYHQWFDGTIEAIRHDSIFFNGLAFHYREIAQIRLERKKLNYRGDGTLLLVAGGGVLVLGAVNGLIRQDQPRIWYSTASFITAGGLMGLGFLLRGSLYKKYTLGRKYSLRYLELGASKK